MRKIIVNSTPLIALAKVNKLEILKGMYEHIIIPEAVRSYECTGKSTSVHMEHYILSKRGGTSHNEAHFVSGIYDAGLGHPFTAFVRTESLGLSRIFRQHLFALYAPLDVVMLLPMHKHLQCRDVDAQLS